MNNLTNPLKWFGGKSYLADWIIKKMPEHTHYVEPYGGGLAVLLNKDPIGVSEVVNDLDDSLMNFWEVLQDPISFGAFVRMVEAVPISQKQWENSWDHAPRVTRDVISAVNFFIRCRQSRTGGFKSFNTLSRSRTRRKMNEQASAWLNSIDGLADVHERLKRVVVLCDDAMKVIEAQDGKHTLFYLDPPYVSSTRKTKKIYKHEMSLYDHGKLLDAIVHCQGKVMISSYPNDLYTDKLKHWNEHTRQIDNKVSSSSKKKIMTESLWCNF